MEKENTNQELFVNQDNQMSFLKQRGYILPIFGIILIILFINGAYYLGTKQTQPTITNPNNLQPTKGINQTSTTSGQDETANWKTYSDNLYSFKYPNDWLAKVGDYSYFGHQAVMTNPQKTVSLRVLTGKQPYGFGAGQEGDFKRQNLEININGQKYEAVEVTSFNKKAYVDLKVAQNGKEYQVLFGTGYPVGEDNLSSLSDYLSSRSTILKILSTFKFLDQQTAGENYNWKEYSSERLKLSFRYPDNLKIREAFSEGDTVYVQQVNPAL